MKIKNGFVVRSIAGESVVVALGEASKNFNGIIKLNDTGRFLWDKLAEGCEKEELVSAILAEYDIDRATAESDIDRFTETLKGANILE
ncbi:MAG: PqqD family protein [Clostridia bacterium]|nr:PqqD family protein [Clostridia bacterium]